MQAVFKLSCWDLQVIHKLLSGHSAGGAGVLADKLVELGVDLLKEDDGFGGHGRK